MNDLDSWLAFCQRQRLMQNVEAKDAEAECICARLLARDDTREQPKE